jgi:hypothetical protein
MLSKPMHLGRDRLQRTFIKHDQVMNARLILIEPLVIITEAIFDNEYFKYLVIMVM